MPDDKKTEVPVEEPKKEEIRETPKETEVKEKVFTLTESELKRLLKENSDESTRGHERERKIGDWVERKDIKDANKTARMKMYQEDGESEWGENESGLMPKNMRIQLTFPSSIPTSWSAGFFKKEGCWESTDSGEKPIRTTPHSGHLHGAFLAWVCFCSQD